MSIAVVPADVAKALRTFLIKNMEDGGEFKAAGVDGYIYSRADILTIMEQWTFAHHLAPVARKKVIEWCFRVALENQLVIKVNKLIAEAQGHKDGEGYILSADNLL